jgi:hypothetical protein
MMPVASNTKAVVEARGIGPSVANSRATGSELLIIFASNGMPFVSARRVGRLRRQRGWCRAVASSRAGVQRCGEPGGRRSACRNSQDSCKPFRRIALGINGDEKRRDASRKRPKILQRGRHLLKRQRTLVRTVRVTEEDEHPAAAIIGIGDAVPFLVGEFERAADRHARGHTHCICRGRDGSSLRTGQDARGRPERTRTQQSRRASALCQRTRSTV